MRIAKTFLLAAFALSSSAAFANVDPNPTWQEGSSGKAERCLDCEAKYAALTNNGSQPACSPGESPITPVGSSYSCGKASPGSVGTSNNSNVAQ